MSIEFDNLPSVYRFDDNEEPISLDSQLFLEYIKSFGFDPNNYKKILEINQSPEKSISRIMNVNNSYLLSRKVNNKDLKKYHINGFYGYLAPRGIVIPRCVINDNIFLNGEPCKQGQGYNHETLGRYGTIISNGIPEEGFKLIKDKEVYIGFSMNDDIYFSSRKVQELLKIKEELIKLSGQEYKLEEDTISSENKRLCLIRKI